jgi:hypothetical protein
MKNKSKARYRFVRSFSGHIGLRRAIIKNNKHLGGNSRTKWLPRDVGLDAAEWIADYIGMSKMMSMRDEEIHLLTVMRSLDELNYQQWDDVPF